MSLSLNGSNTFSDRPNIAERLKDLRDTQSLTQRELARRVGISHTAVAKIERGESSPTIALLQKIADAFNLTFLELLYEEEAPADRIFYKHNELTTLISGPITLKQIGGNLRKNALQVMYDVYEPGADSGDAMITHAGEEAGIIIAGNLEVTVGQKQAVLCAGDAYLFDSRMPHRFRNVGEDKCVIVTAATPPSF